MNLTIRQQHYRDHLLARIGFLEDDFFREYLKEFIESAPKFKLLGALKAIDEHGNPAPETQSRKYALKNDILIPKTFTSLDLVLIEYKRKVNRDFIRKPITTTITASDISNFTYCPVSYAINKSFKIDEIEQTKIGKSQHERSMFTNFQDPSKILNFELKFEKGDYGQYSQEQKELARIFLKSLKNSTPISIGHKDGRSFENSETNFRGEPDYIFRHNHTLEYYVVEEKYQFLNTDREDRNEIFFENHINQLRAYISQITDYNISYGYLVYWKYKVAFNSSIEITGFTIKQIFKDSETFQISLGKIREIQLVLSSGEGRFTREFITPAKCANCIVGIYCGHKTGRYPTYSIPYHGSYFRTRYIATPISLQYKGAYIGFVEFTTSNYLLELFEFDNVKNYTLKIIIENFSYDGTIYTHFEVSNISNDQREKLNLRPQVVIRGHLFIRASTIIMEEHSLIFL